MFTSSIRYFIRSTLFAAVAPLAACSVAPVVDGQPPVYTQKECGPAASADASVGERGPFAVGYRTFDKTYAGPASAGTRTVKVHVWYPAASADGDGARYLNLFPDDEVHTDAPPAKPLSACGFPLFAHSHGHMGFAGGGSHLLKRLASHGWVVVAPDHTGNTFADNLDPLPDWFHLARATDIAASVDAIRDLPADDPLAGKVAIDRYILSGHSYGTFTAWIAGGARFDPAQIDERCAEMGCDQELKAAYLAGAADPRVAGIIPMAGGYRTAWLGESGFHGVKVPILQMTGSNDPVGAEETWPLFNGITISWIELAGGCHETFNLGACETLDVPEGYDILGTWALAFARYHLLGDRSAEVAAIVTGAQSVSPKVTLLQKEP